MSLSLQAVREAVRDLLPPEQVEMKETGGKVLLTLAANVPMGEKPAFAERVKQAVGVLEGVREVFVSFTAAPQPAGGPAPGPQPLDGVKRIVAVGAGKGGVGKSTVAVNLAVALAQAGEKVGLLDADIYGPSAAMMTGAIGHKARADEQQRVIPAERHGIHVVSIAFLLPEDQSAVVWRGPMVGKMVQQLLMGVAWGELDTLIVDLPPGTGDAVLSLSQTVPLDGAIVVTTPQDVALLDVLKAIEMFQTVKVPVLGVVENMSGFTCPSCGQMTPIFLSGAGAKAAERFDLPLLGTLPLEASIPPGGDQGRPIVIEQPESAVAKAFAKIAAATDERLEQLAGRAPGRFRLDWDGGG